MLTCGILALPVTGNTQMCKLSSLQSAESTTAICCVQLCLSKLDAFSHTLPKYAVTCTSTVISAAATAHWSLSHSLRSVTTWSLRLRPVCNFLPASPIN
eukprot:3128-Heterococcus_DN1.PRE.3